ncbi:alpha/beta-hydrolase [Cylindrobasidium torrendii FP15055 ss-10]|uniref:Alpha/beta-hydrolase n=1 Tax=Cylindrobasidium torrendii FP15055 ss-10 TaxID=1314674 RepID=A0A0D7BEK1_9AGAR|nr:alpha/beta-hydrolase [Cylindrobasidium torrendii FP15055 ss-10]
MFFFGLVNTFLSLSALVVLAAPIRRRPGVLDEIFGIGSSDDKASSTTTALSPADLDTKFKRAAEFSRAAYCPTAEVTNRTCGASCDALGNDVEFLLSGGDEGDTPLFMVALDKATNTIFVAHQGTNPDNIMSILNDADFVPDDIDTRFITSAGDDVKVHNGFQDTFLHTADAILNATMSALQSTGAQKLVLTGHSLGAAIATLDALMFKDALAGSNVTMSTTLFGSPRIGNKEFADFLDSQLGSSLSRITNREDPVPLLPPQFLSFAHASGEVHINAVDEAGNATDIVSCAGKENQLCSDKGNILSSDVSDHSGPYFSGISFGSSQCLV